MRFKPAFLQFKPDYEKRCPICKTPIFHQKQYPNKIYCDIVCRDIHEHIQSARHLIELKKLKLILQLIDKPLLSFK